MSEPQDRNTGLITIDRGGVAMSGVHTGIKANSFTIRQLSARKRENGWVIRGDSLTEWQPSGLTEHDGQIYVAGPLVRGVFVDQAIEDDERDRLSDLVAIASALAVIREHTGRDLPLHTRSIILLDDGGVFVLPPEIISSIIGNADIREKVRIRARVSHPDRDDRSNQSFFLAALAYFVLTNRFPFEAETAEELNGRIRAGIPVPARLRRVDVRKDVSNELDAVLGLKSEAPDPGELAAKLEHWARNGTTDPIDDKVRAEREQMAAAEIDKLDRSFGRGETVRRNWRRWAIIAAIVTVAAFIPGTILRNALRPPATAGMGPEEVVQAFYWSINTFDHMTMEDATTDGAGRTLIREVTNLFVIDRQRMSVEMRSGFVDARDWEDESRPALPDGLSPYGLTSLSLESAPAAEDERAYLVRYDRWLPNAETGPDGLPTGPRTIGIRVTDLVRLRPNRDYWVIYELSNQSLEEIR